MKVKPGLVEIPDVEEARAMIPAKGSCTQGVGPAHEGGTLQAAELQG